ncbi:hypothetical protein Ddye_022033 [Dipteronia dyeriana]|uniref:Transmembrane protein n=1 Tax=Dipteronia dyeriana TaxID=168575 RepID=A0AAD9U3I6_9ROSI|nr:hypothetical protein Ddye_022033 [Dipteronia dyeriana]
MKNPIFYLNTTRFHSTLPLHSSAAPSPTRHHDIPSRVGLSARTNPFRCLSHIAQKPHEAFFKKSPPRRQKMIFMTRPYGSSQSSSNNNNTDDDVEASKKEEKKKRVVEVEVKLGKMVSASVISTLAMVFALKWFTFWASKKGQDAFYLPIFIFVCMLVVHIAKHLQL